MADRTISILIDHTASLNSSYLANQGEEITLDITIPAGLVALALDGYIDFELPDGTAYFKGPFSCATGTISTTLGATDSILDASGKVHWQFVLAVTTGSVRDVKWKSKQYDTEVLTSIGATNAAILPYVPQMVFPTMYPAANISVADVPGLYVGTDAETVLTDIAGTGRTTEKLSHLGLIASLLTTAKTNLAAAINELFTDKMNKAGGSANPFTAMPYVDTAPVAASGFISGKGSYVKFADGTMIAWYNPTSGVGNILDDGIYLSPALTWVLPDGFYSKPEYSATISRSVVLGAYPLGVLRISASDYTQSSIPNLYVHYHKLSSAVQVNLSLLAIGRWKE